MKTNDYTDYLHLMETFLSGEISPTDFEARYLALFKSDQRLFPDNIYQILNRLFSDVDSFTSDPAIRGKDDLDADDLLECCRLAHQQLLQAVGGHDATVKTVPG